MRFAVALTLACVSAMAVGQAPMPASHLPIVHIDTRGQAIPDLTRVVARMGVIDNGPGRLNQPSDPWNAYDGRIAIELRGSSSQMFPKKQYALETQHEDGTNRNVGLLGLPAENDWILYAPYSDKSLLRNVLAYSLARRTGRYASRHAFCELILNGEYRGLYVLFEKIKRDRNRVDLPRLVSDGDDDLSGGYIVKIDKTAGEDIGGWLSTYPPYAGSPHRILYQYHYPAPSDITSEQAAYIQSVFEGFESHMSRPDITGYESVIDVDSFVDYALVTELGKNVDGYRLSAFLYKDRDDRDPRLHAGPIWDYNLAFGNADYYGGFLPQGWQVNFLQPQDQSQVPFWWRRLFADDVFQDRLRRRWTDLRHGPFALDSINADIDALADRIGEAAERNFARWPVLGTYVWPNAYVGATWASEIEYLRQWLERRLVWMDGLLLENDSDTDPPDPTVPIRIDVFPNPMEDDCQIRIEMQRVQPVDIGIYDSLGRRVARIDDTGWETGEIRTTWSTEGLPPGIYLLKARAGTVWAGRALVKAGASHPAR